jgi:hypothetical protein
VDWKLQRVVRELEEHLSKIYGHEGNVKDVLNVSNLWRERCSHRLSFLTNLQNDIQVILLLEAFYIKLCFLLCS